MTNGCDKCRNNELKNYNLRRKPIKDKRENK
jgi:hypothetical protein